MKLILILTLITFNLKAPISHQAVIFQPEPINPYKPLTYAIGKVECNFDTLAYNPIEGATGYYQIRQIRLDHYNLLTGSTYVLADMYDYEIAEKVFLYFADRIGPYNFEKIAKDWNGSGSMTVNYWIKVKSNL